MQQKIFDRFRQCILKNADWEAVIIPSSNVPRGIVLWLNKNIQDHEHAVVIYTEGKDIIAFQYSMVSQGHYLNWE